MNKFMNNSIFFVLAPTFIIASDFIVTKFSSAKTAPHLANGHRKFLDGTYGKHYNTNLKRYPKEKYGDESHK